MNYKQSAALRYFFHIGYNGNNYRGWQRHPYGVNVQKTIEDSLQKILKVPISIVGCGRTDAQVHATQFFFHLDVETHWEFDMLFRLNKTLPPDIAVFDIIPMEGLPHARFDANQRDYDYFIHTYKDPFLTNVSSFYRLEHLDLDRMKAATALLPQYTDYSSFCLTPAEHDSTICYISAATWYTDAAGDKLRFQISANRYLRRMIRILVGQLLQVGNGTLSMDAFESHLAAATAPVQHYPAHPQGLFLSKVTYPYLNLPARSTFSAIQNTETDAIWKAL